MRVRQSTLKTFGDCAWQFYYESVLQLPPQKNGSLTVLGSVWHFAIQVYEEYGGNLGLALRTFDYYWDNPDGLGLSIDFYHNRTSHEGLRKRGKDMLRRYHELQPWKSGQLIGTEIHFVVPIGDHELEGTIDKVWARPRNKTLEIVDYKTGAKVPEKLRFNLQFTAYAYATMKKEFWGQVPGFTDGYERYKDYKRQGWWFHARNNKKYSAGYREDKDYKRLLVAVNQMSNCVESNSFPLTVAGDACGYCPYEDICGSEVDSPVGG